MEPTGEPRLAEALRKASTQIRALRDENDALAARGPIAVIGMGCRFPGGATDPERFWQLLEDGRDAVAEIPRDRFDLDRWWDVDPDAVGRFYVREAALLDDVRRFDAAFFGITPTEAEAMDPQQRLLLEVSWEAFEDARLDPKRLAGSRTGLFLGLSNYDYIQAHIHSGDPARITPQAGSGVMFSTAAGRLSYFYDLRGPCVTLDTACSSSLVALNAAIKALRRQECDTALAGGVSLLLSPDSMVALCKVRALAADGRSRAFDEHASGYGRGEGCGLVLLKRLDYAIRDGDPVHAVLAGSAVNHDGRSNGLTAPNGLAQQAVIRAALEDARLAPDAIDYIEAHGTGTPLGDPIEFGALDAVFGRRPMERALRLGSVKTNIGHTEAAAGIAGVMKVILAMRHGIIPASLHFETPNRHIDWEASSIAVTGSASPWNAGERLRVAGVSSFGLSGTNAHIVVTAPPVTAHPAAEARPMLALPISAATPKALAASADRWRARIETAGDAELADLCAVAARRSPLRERMVAIGPSREALAEALRSGAAHEAPSHATSPSRGLVFLFSGQGAHHVGMGRALHASEPVFRSAFDRCEAVVGDGLGQPLTELLGDASALSRTEVAQPLLFSLQWSLAELWASRSVRPDAVVGHSVGEFAAAAIAGIFEPEEALWLVLERGRRMQALPAGGAMAAVFASTQTVAPFLSSHAGRVAIAAINGTGSVTLSGEEEALAAVLTNLAERSIGAPRLDVSHAFHSPLMAPMVPLFRTACEGVRARPAGLPFYSTVSGGRRPAHALLDADYWCAQIEAPVRFADAIEALKADGYGRFLEIGPGDILSALARHGGALTVSSLRRGVERSYGVELKMSQLFTELGTLGDIEAYLAKHATRRTAAIAPEAPAFLTVPPDLTISAGSPVEPVLPSPDAGSLFQQQLKAMAEMSAQHLRSLTELSRQQLATAGGAVLPAAAPQPAPAQAQPVRPRAPTPVPVAAIRGIHLAGARLTPEQQAFVETLVQRHVSRTRRSRARHPTSSSRRCWESSPTASAGAISKKAASKACGKGASRKPPTLSQPGEQPCGAARNPVLPRFIMSQNASGSSQPPG
nr:type I polyketide synthase [Sphingomonas sp. PR090111-T3T-6A]